MKLDILAFGAHPDDVELSCSGLLLLEKSRGKKTGVIDLTRGELGSRGNAEIRKKEAEKSSEILKLDIRENLEMADGFFQNDEFHQRKIIVAIRKYQPEVVLCNAPEDRHPDHGRAARLVSDAAFLSGLTKIETTDNGIPQQAWRPKLVLNYIQDQYFEPDFVLDITEHFDGKIASISAYETQFYNPDIEGPATYISTPEFWENIKCRHKMFGNMIGVLYGEGFLTRKTIGISTLDALIKSNK